MTLLSKEANPELDKSADKHQRALVANHTGSVPRTNPDSSAIEEATAPTSNKN